MRTNFKLSGSKTLHINQDGPFVRFDLQYFGALIGALTLTPEEAEQIAQATAQAAQAARQAADNQHPAG